MKTTILVCEDLFSKSLRLLHLAFVYWVVVTSLPAAAQQAVEEVVITAEFIPDEKLATSEVADLLDAETMSIAGDSDLGSALKRVPGLSLVGGKFIYVRGLGERYSATYFNGTPMPSPEPLQRAVPLDLFDTSVTKNVLVQKTHSANYGIEFSGGAVDIRSVAVPDEGFFKFKVSTGYNDISTGKLGLTYDGGSQDWLGRDDGGRALPAELSGNLDLYPNIFTTLGDHQNTARLSFTNNDWDASRSSNPYDYGLSIGGGQRFELHDRLSVGVIGVASLSNTWRNRETESTNYVPGTIELGNNAIGNLDVLVPNIDTIRRNALDRQDTTFTDPSSGSDLGIDNIGILTIEDEERTQRSIRSNTLLSVGAIVDQQHFINLTNLIARKTTDTVFSSSSIKVNPDIFSLRTTIIDWIENEIDFKQLSGEHLVDSATVQWRYAIVESSRDNLDSKEASTRSTSADQPFELDNLAEPKRRFAFLDDRTTDFGIDIELPFISDRKFFTDFNLKFGASKTEQQRKYQGLEFEYALRGLPGRDDPVRDLPLNTLLAATACSAGSPNPVDPPTVGSSCFLATDFNDNDPNAVPTNAIGLQDGSASNTDDFYSGVSRFEAQYVILDMQILDTLRFNAGVRRERSLLEVRNSEGDLFVLNPGLAPPQLRQTDQLSSMSVTWDFYQNMILRAAYSETVNRPILRELAAVRLFNPDDGRFYIGNSELRTAEIENFDLRYEMYFGDDDYFSVSAFRKRIDNPIEVFQRETTEEILAFRWENSELAVNEGFEFELRKCFTPEFYMTTNATFIDSSVTDIGDNQRLLRLSGITERSLTGVSKELYNLQLVYRSSAVEASLSYNKYSRRVDSLLVSPVGATFVLVVEEPFASLDANFKYKLDLGGGTLNIGFKVSNLLDDSVERVADNLGGLPFENYDVGQTYGLSLEWKQ